jgi:hypothetical protein
MSQESGYPPWVFVALTWVGGSLATAIVGLFFWVLNLYRKKVDALEKNSVTKADMAALELRMAELASRRELIAYLEQWRDERTRMHEENKASIAQLHDDIETTRSEVRSARSEVRDDIRAVHNRIDQVLK